MKNQEKEGINEPFGTEPAIRNPGWPPGAQPTPGAWQSARQRARTCRAAMKPNPEKKIANATSWRAGPDVQTPPAFALPTYPRTNTWGRLSQTTTATTAHSGHPQGSGPGNGSGRLQGVVVGSFHGYLFLYVQELAPCPQLRVVAGASLSLSLSASV